jgi:hypothetical protein
MRAEVALAIPLKSCRRRQHRRDGKRHWRDGDAWHHGLGKVLHHRDLGGIAGATRPPLRREAVAGVEAICVGHGIQTDRVRSGIRREIFRHGEHGGAKTVPLPRIVDGDEAKDGAAVGFDVDPDGADDLPIDQENKRMVSRIGFVGVVGVVFEVVRRTFAVVLLEQATLTNFVVADPFT